MNILILPSWYPNKNNINSGIFIKEQAKAIKETGINVIVFFPYDSSMKKKALSSEYEDGILTYRSNTDYISNTKLSRINSIIKVTGYLRKIVMEHNIDLIHAQVCYSAGFAAAFYKKRFGVPFIITEHMSYIDKYNRKRYNRLLFKYAYSSADMVIPVSSFLEREMKAMGFKFKSTVIGNVVSNSEEVQIENIGHTSVSNILFVGMMTKNRVKGFEYLVPAYSKALVKYDNMRLNIVGDGELASEYKRMCEDYGISEKVIFHGKLDKKALRILMLRCDFLISSSIKETFGSVLIEAMAEGLPVLATRCGGPEDFINERVGLLVDKESIEALEAGIIEMIKNLQNYDSNYIRDYALDNFGYKNIGNKIKSIYDSIL